MSSIEFKAGQLSMLKKLRKELKELLKSHYAIKKEESDDALGREMFGDPAGALAYYLEGVDIQIKELERELS